MMDLEELFAMPDLPDDNAINMDIVAQIQRRRRQLIIHSHLYYQMNTSLISDHQYDEWAQDLIRLQKDYPKEAERAPFHKDFDGFQMGDSFGLPIHEPWVHDQCVQLLRYHEGLKKKGE